MTTERKPQHLIPLGIGFSVAKKGTPAGYSVGVAFTTTDTEGGLDTSGYTPPLGYRVGLGFSGQHYAPPAGYAVGIEFGTHKQDDDSEAVTLKPDGIDWPGMGEHAAKNQQEFIRPQGLDSYRQGYPEAYNASQYLQPSSIAPKDGYGQSEIWNVSEQMWAAAWDSQSFGQPNIWNRNQHITGAGAIPSALAFGRHSVWLYTRYLALGGINSERFGTQWASHFLREIIASKPVDLLGVGKPWAVEDPRFLTPKGIDPIDIADRHEVGGLRFIEPVGNEMTEWGTRIIPESTDAHTHGRSMMEFGDTGIKNHITYVKPAGFRTQPDEELRFGYQHAWNLRQIIQQDYDPNDGLNPPPFGQWTAIENRNKEPQTHGWLSHRFGYQFIWNRAAPLLPAGIAPPENEPFYKAGSVTHHIRPIPPAGIDSLAMTQWAAITNAATPLRPAGFDSMETDSLPAIENRSRKYERVGNFDSMSIGTAFIADAVRELSIEQRYAIQPPRIELPIVDLYTRYIDEVTLGDPKFGVGHPGTTIRWTIIYPRWAFHPPAFIGEPGVRNVTPEIKQFGASSEEFGDIYIRTQWREVRTDGASTDLFGKPIIRDRRHWVEFVGGMPPPNIMPGPAVTRIGGLPDLQRITPEGFVLVDKQGKFGLATVGAQELHPEGIDPLRMGSAEVFANSIRVEPGLYEHKFGEPWLSLKNRTLDVAGKGIEPITNVGKPRLSPHTIYAVMEAPQQAKNNHPPQELHYVDHDPRTNRSIKGVGSHRISQNPQYIKPSGFANQSSGSWWVGTPNGYNALSRIEPDGIQSARYGFPAMQPHDQEVIMRAGTDFQAFGATGVVRPPYTGPQTITGRGYATMAFGMADIDHLNRQRSLTGFDALAMGASKPGDTPYQWQGLRIGPLMPTMPNGFDAALFGEGSWVSYRVRELSVQGFDAFACEYDYTNFEARMRVWRHVETPPMQMATAAGFETSSFGYHEARNRAHYIRPDGNAEVFRKGAGNA